MARRPTGKGLKRWEVSIIKGMIASGDFKDQVTHSFFTRPSRSINQREISQIRNQVKFANVKVASEADVKTFLSLWPNIDYETGAALEDDELLIKSREAMLAAVQTFNSGGLNFRSELFIVTAVIAWTYALHSWFKKESVDYWYKNTDGSPKLTRAEGPIKYWELSHCLKHTQCPLDHLVVSNLEFLIEIRNEIEHRMTGNLDHVIGAKLQACCINFNDFLSKQFGEQFSLEKRLPLALQFVTFSSEQRLSLKGKADLPQHILTKMETFEDALTEEQRLNPAYAYRVIFAPKSANHKSSSDLAVEFIRSDSEDAENISRVLMKEVDKARFPATQIVRLVQERGYPNFSMYNHSQLWNRLDAKSPEKKFGRQGDYANSWVWYRTWLDRVLLHCEEQGDEYR